MLSMITLTKTAAFTIETPRISIHPQHKVLVREDGYVLTSMGWTNGALVNTGYRYAYVAHKPRTVHRLVAETFLDNPDEKPTVDHINRVRDDNRLDNLRWATYKEQNNNSSIVLNARDLGVRRCDNPKEYHRRNTRIYYAEHMKDPAWAEKEKQRISEYRKTEKGRANARERTRRYRERKKARAEAQALL